MVKWPAVNPYYKLRLILVALFATSGIALTACADEAIQTTSGNSGVASITPTFAATVVFSTIEPTPTATPLPTPTPSPTPTPDPQALIQQAQRASHNGDDAQAVMIYSAALSAMDQITSEVALHLRFSLGQSQYGAGDTTGAIDTFTAILSDAITSTAAVDSRVPLGRAKDVLGDHAGAIAQYQAALTSRTVISSYLNLWIGDAYIAANQPLSAVLPYQNSLTGTPNLTQEFARREKLALALQLTGQYVEALFQYDTILSSAKFTSYRARIMWESAQVLAAMSQTNTAYQRMREVVTSYPETGAAFSALQVLLEAGQPVDDLQRGIVDYYNGAYQAAQQAFRRAINTDSLTNEVRYWAALNYNRLGSPNDANRNLNEIISEGPSALRYGDALLRRAEWLANSGDVDNAVSTYRALASNAPSDPQAGLAMQRVGRLYEREDQIQEAAQAHLDAQSSYPLSEGAAEALLRGSVMLYRLARYAEVVTQTQKLLDAYPAAVEAPLAQLWQARALITSGQLITAQITLSGLLQADPDSYVAARAAEFMRDAYAAPLTKPAWQVISSATQIAEQSLNESDAWVRVRLKINSGVDVRSLSSEIIQDARFIRGAELWRLGLRMEARDELESLRVANTQSVLAMYQLALYFSEIGLYRSSISCADAFMRLTHVGSATELPDVVARLLYPIYYADLIQAQSSEYGLDPLLVVALIRQESLFESFAASGASAYGLMQVIPGTANEINTALQWPPDYTVRDLTRPYVSIRFGAYYLARQRDFLQGDLYAALAAYNGGPGMALRWRERAGSDPDVLYLTMPLDGTGYRETQTYIRTVAANYAMYHRLYAGD